MLFLTGTPMENKVQEFRALVGHLRPEVAEHLDIADEALDGTRFRERVAGLPAAQHRRRAQRAAGPAGDAGVGGP